MFSSVGKTKFAAQGTRAVSIEQSALTYMSFSCSGIPSRWHHSFGAFRQRQPFPGFLLSVLSPPLSSIAERGVDLSLADVADLFPFALSIVSLVVVVLLCVRPPLAPTVSQALTSSTGICGVVGWRLILHSRTRTPHAHRRRLGYMGCWAFSGFVSSRLCSKSPFRCYWASLVGDCVVIAVVDWRTPLPQSLAFNAFSTARWSEIPFQCNAIPSGESSLDVFGS